MVLHPATRRLGRWWLLALLIAVFPANVHMAVNPEQIRGLDLRQDPALGALGAAAAAAAGDALGLARDARLLTLRPCRNFNSIACFVCRASVFYDRS